MTVRLLRDDAPLQRGGRMRAFVSGPSPVGRSRRPRWRGQGWIECTLRCAAPGYAARLRLYNDRQKPSQHRRMQPGNGRRGKGRTGEKDSRGDGVQAAAAAAASAAGLHVPAICDPAAPPVHRVLHGAAAQRHVGHPQRAPHPRKDERLKAKAVVKALVQAGAELQVEVGQEDGGVAAGSGNELLRRDDDALPAFVPRGCPARWGARASSLHGCCCSGMCRSLL